MQLSHRLTRAGLAFIVFGGASALLPTNGNASAATDGCTVAGQSYSVGTTSGDTTTSFSAAGGSVALNSYLGADSATATSLTDSDSAGFTTTISGGTITTTKSMTAPPTTSDVVTVNFPNGRTVTYTVTP